MIEGIQSSSTESLAGLSHSGGIGATAFGGGQQQQARAAQQARFGDVLDVSTQGRAQAQAAQSYQTQSARGEQPDIDGLIRQAQAAYQQARQRGYGQYAASTPDAEAQAAAQGYSAAATILSRTPQTVEGYLNTNLPQTVQPRRAAATYRSMQTQGMRSSGLAPLGTGISITV